MTADRDAAILLACVLVASLALGGLAVVITADTAAAQEEPSTLDRVIGDDVGTMERVSVANDAIVAVADRLLFEAQSAAPLVEATEASADELAANLTTTYNSNNATIEAYVNNRTTVPDDADVVEIEVRQDEETSTRYLVAETDADGNVTNSSIVSSTDREVDGTLVLEGYAAAEASNELETFVDDYAEPGDDVDAALRRRMANQYAGHVTLPEFGGTA